MLYTVPIGVNSWLTILLTPFKLPGTAPFASKVALAALQDDT